MMRGNLRLKLVGGKILTRMTSPRMKTKDQLIHLEEHARGLIIFRIILDFEYNIVILRYTAALLRLHATVVNIKN